MDHVSANLAHIATCHNRKVSSNDPSIEILSQHELRNESDRVLRAVSEGHSFIVTNHGVAVGRLGRLEAPTPGLRITRPAKRAGGWTALAIERKSPTYSLSLTLAELRQDRR